MTGVTVVIPAFNEEGSICEVITSLREALEKADIESEILVVVDGATDATAARAVEVADRVIEHPQNLGYGRSLKTGILSAKHELIAITDADKTYPPESLPGLIRLADRDHMVVGARTGSFYKGGFFKRIGRWVFKCLSEYATGQRIPDINSGMRVFRKSHIVPFFPVISAGFSFTTTSTLVFLLNGLTLHYEPIAYRHRVGRSKVRHLSDSIRALQIIVEAILRCNPIKVFLLLAAPFFVTSLLTFAAFAVWPLSELIVAGSLSLCTAGLVLAIGFLAVTVVHRRPALDVELTLPVSPVASSDERGE
ncbi:MAG: glycosyltransferase family 2 protein [Pirellulaceae bacterium]